MKIVCRHCQGKVVPKMEKIETALGGGLLITAVAAAFGLGGGWIALGVAAFGGSKVAELLLRAKVKLMQESNKLGSYFHCENCKKDAQLSDVFGQLIGSNETSPPPTEPTYTYNNARKLTKEEKREALERRNNTQKKR